VLGMLVEAGLVDELFLTISPLLAGRESREPRPGLIQDVAFLPSRSMSGRLLSIRRGRSDLFLRYALARSRRARARPVP
jgi:riboflavin biosynthesis pyrimidine reductase